MSLFIAVRPSLDAVEHLQDALHDLRRLPSADDVRWTSSAMWHITLGFLGDPDAAVDEEIVDRLSGWSGRGAIDGARLESAGRFGREVLWVGLAEGPAREELTGLSREIPPLLRGSGAVVDRRTWRPHLTIGRMRRGSPELWADALSSYRGPTWSVQEIEVVRSSGGPRPHHEVVGRIPLAA